MNNYAILVAQNDDITTDMFDTGSSGMFDSNSIDVNNFDTGFDNNQNQQQNQDYNQQDYNQNYNQNNYQATSEIPALPAVTPERPSEMQTVMQKSSISFGVLALIIVGILICAFLFKKIKNKQEYVYEAKSEETFEDNLNTETPPPPVVEPEKPKRKSSSKLNTPANLHRCIIAFLEITKEI